MIIRYRLILVIFIIAQPLSSQASDEMTVKIASKTFTENVILGELTTHLINQAGIEATHQPGLGGTQVLWNALLQGDIDIYPEYTGTLREEIFAGRELKTFEALRQRLLEKNILISQPFGFNNTYAIGMKKAVAAKYQLRTISDLKHYPNLNLGFGNEFMDRQDGWPNLRQYYQLPHTNVRGLEHDLAYRGLDSGSIDVTDAYATDAEIAYYDLQILADDKHYFPKYHAVLLYRADLQVQIPNIIAILQQLEGNISDAEMIAMNVRAKLDKISENRVAAEFLTEKFGISPTVVEETVMSRLYKHTIEHLMLVTISVFAAIMVSIPLGILAAKFTSFGQVILGGVGMIQTIPSLALLVFMIPLLGIGNAPAIAALFLYSLLPIVRNTYTGLHNISPQIRESAEALGLSAWARLRLIELPLASRSIFAGIKTSAIINIGFATLGALIGAGGYGQPILTGIRLDDMGLILQGAIPAAILALLVQGFFELTEKLVVPTGLQINANEE